MKDTVNVSSEARTRHTRMVRSHEGSGHWLFMHQDLEGGARPCFHGALMDEIWEYMDQVTQAPCPEGRMRHLVLASDGPAFNLGGDLALFSTLIRAQDQDGLLAYARQCIEGVHQLHTGLGGGVRSIALVEGDALGGGFEMALACQGIVAEEGVHMGLPEVTFGLFPGMGAYSFLTQRVAPKLAEKMILGGALYRSEELHEMGIVDVLAPRGQGREEVQEIISRQRKTPFAHMALNQVRGISRPVSLDELLEIGRVWVDTALALGERSLKMMERLGRAQDRKVQRETRKVVARA